MIRRLVLSLVVVSTAALGATACSSNDTDSTAGSGGSDQSSAADAADSGADDGAASTSEDGLCSVLSEQEVEALVGEPVTPGISTTLGAGDGCIWASKTSSTDVFALQVREIPQAEFDGRLTGTDDAGVPGIPVAGIGEAAYSFEPGFTTELAFRQGGTAYGVTRSIEGATPEQQRAANEAAARKILENL